MMMIRACSHRQMTSIGHQKKKRSLTLKLNEGLVNHFRSSDPHSNRKSVFLQCCSELRFAICNRSQSLACHRDLSIILRSNEHTSVSPSFLDPVITTKCFGGVSARRSVCLSMLIIRISFIRPCSPNMGFEITRVCVCVCGARSTAHSVADGFFFPDLRRPSKTKTLRFLLLTARHWTPQ